MSELNGFFRLKKDLGEKEWNEFLRVAARLTDDQLRYVRDAVDRPIASYAETVKPIFTSRDELRALLLASQHSLPTWLRPQVMASWQVMDTYSPRDTLHQVHARRLQGMLQIDWSNVPPLEFNYETAYKNLTLQLPGMEKVIEQVLKHLSLYKRADGNVGIQPIAFVGPPGVGKTTLAKLVAKELRLPFEQLQMASMADSESVTGSWIGYENGGTGMVIDLFVKNRTPRIVLFLDEFCELYRTGDRDKAGKVGSSFIDLMENNCFFDTFWGVPAELAPVTFLTINELAAIPEKIRQRFKIIECSPYLPTEKAKIAHYMWFDNVVKFHLDTPMTESAASEIVRRSRNEGGARSIREACLKLAAELATMEVMPEELTVEFVREHLPDQNPPHHLHAQVGCAGIIGVDGNGIGELSRMVVVLEDDDQRQVMITGGLKEGARESIQNALAVARRLTGSYRDQRTVTIQMGSVGLPKDGSSAGLSACVALISAYRNKAVPGEIAFTGEVCVDGTVMPVGALLAKAVAAQVAGCTRLYIPADCMEERLKELDIEVIPVTHVCEVLEQLDLL